jgi:hypothetical protein
MGPFDVLQTLFGRPPAEAQLATALGQGPGQPGSPQGPQPLAGQNGPPGGPAGPGGSPDPSGGPAAPQQQQQQQAPPQPQAYTSPPDLAQAYLALSQQNQAREGFWSGLSGVAAALHPGRVTPAMMKAIAGPQGQDAGSLFSNLVQLQQYQQQNQALQAYRQGVPAMVKAAGLPDSFVPLAMADPTLLSKIVETQAGVGGSQTDKEYKNAIKVYQDANPGKPLPPELQTEAGFAAQQAGNITTAKTKADDLAADQHNFGPALGNYDKGIGLIDQFMTPEMQEGAKEFLGTGGSIRPVATMSGPGKKAWALYKQIMATQFSAGVQDFKGAGRITQQELTQDAPSQSTMGQLNQDPGDFFAGVQKYRDQLAQKRAGLFGTAQKGDDPRLSDEDYSKYVAPNIDLYGGPKRDVSPSAGGGGGTTDLRSSKDPNGDYEKLPSGAVFIAPDGQQRRKP